MSFNNGNERRKLNAKWEQSSCAVPGSRNEAKMQFQNMYEFDLVFLIANVPTIVTQ